MTRTVPHLRILLIAPSPQIIGGQSIQAMRLLKELEACPGISVQFQPINPDAPPPFQGWKRRKYLRTLATEATYTSALLQAIRRNDIVHIFTAGYSSFLLVTWPAVALARLLR